MPSRCLHNLVQLACECSLLESACGWNKEFLGIFIRALLCNSEFIYVCAHIGCNAYESAIVGTYEEEEEEEEETKEEEE